MAKTVRSRKGDDLEARLRAAHDKLAHSMQGAGAGDQVMSGFADAYRAWLQSLSAKPETLFALGLRIDELTGLRRDDMSVMAGHRVVTVSGKGSASNSNSSSNSLGGNPAGSTNPSSNTNSNPQNPSANNPAANGDASSNPR